MFVPISNSVVAGRYELIDEIGRGGMGVVWRARQANLGIECAVKFIHAALAHDPEVRRRFVREARAAASLKSPNSVHILDVDEWQGTLFIAMELLSGESLEARLAREGSLSPALTLDIVEQVARGLNKAHAARLVHRDLKPENIFLLDEEPLLVKILDFGIAKRIDATSGLHTTSGVLVGTPGYMSPEQADGGKEIDYRSDLWSLAVVAFRCLTGAAPFEGDGLGQVLVKVMTGPIPAPRSIRPSLPPRVDEWWFRVIERDPALRPASATALAKGLREALAEAITIAADPRPTTGAESIQPTLRPVSSGPARRPRPLWRYGIGAAALLTVGLAVALRWVAAAPRGVDDRHLAEERAALRDERARAARPAAAGSSGAAAASSAEALLAAPAIAPIAPAAATAPDAAATGASRALTAPASAATQATVRAGGAPARPSAAPAAGRPSARAIGSAASAAPSPRPAPSASAPKAPPEPQARAATPPKAKSPDSDSDNDNEAEQAEPDLFRNPWPLRNAAADDPRLGF